MIQYLLIANRGEIACHIIRAAVERRRHRRGADPQRARNGARPDAECAGGRGSAFRPVAAVMEWRI